MALSSLSIKFGSISCPYENLRNGTSSRLKLKHVLFAFASPKPSLHISADLTPKVRFVARRTESVSVPQLQRPLSNVRMTFRISLYAISWLISQFCQILLLFFSGNLWVFVVGFFRWVYELTGESILGFRCREDRESGWEYIQVLCV